MKNASERLIIFGRYPVPGKAKTRLIPRLGPAGAAFLHRELMEMTLDTAKEFASERVMGVEVCFEGGSMHEVRKWLGPNLIFSRQRSGNLGERMHSAFRRAFHGGCHRVVLIGSDVPEIGRNHLKQAFHALDGNDIVLGPGTDGGYWLIGMKSPFDLFKGIDWGTESVLDRTITLAKKERLTIYLLEPLSDIDTPENLARWRPEAAWGGPYLSIIIPTLNEEDNIESTICRARDEDAEVIVSDGGSMDRTVTIAVESGARVVKGPSGRALQQNNGAAACRGRTLLFLHADTHLPKGYVKLIFHTLMDPGTIAGAFRFKTDLDNPLMKAMEYMVNFRSEQFGLPYGDQGLFLEKSLFESLGGFPDVPVAEDLYLVRRLKKLGSVRTAPAYAVTSARRWQRLGFTRTTLVNYLILAGCLLRVRPEQLAKLYRMF